jgi:hypothetical protein
VDALLHCFVNAKANSFENLLDPFLKLCRLSTAVTINIAKAQFIRRIIDKLSASKAVVRLNLLRILRAVCEVHPNRIVLVERYGLYDIVRRLSRDDGAVLVRELAREILPTLKPALKPVMNRSSSHIRNSSILPVSSGRLSPSVASNGSGSRVGSPGIRGTSPVGAIGLSPPKAGIVPKKRIRRTASETSPNIQPSVFTPPTPGLTGAMRTPMVRQKSKTQLGDFQWRSPSMEGRQNADTTR